MCLVLGSLAWHVVHRPGAFVTAHLGRLQHNVPWQFLFNLQLLLIAEPSCDTTELVGSAPNRCYLC